MLKPMRFTLGFSLLALAAGCGPGSAQIGTAGSSFETQNGEAITGGICPGAATVQGVDVSEFQGAVDWGSVKASGRAFAIARIGDGTYLDPTFDANWSGIKAAGLIRGAYQFFEPGDNPITLANIVISKVGKLGAGDLPVMLDVEVMGGQSAATVVANIGSWLNAVEAGTGKKPFIYTGAYFWDDNIGSAAFASYALNVAWYGTNCPGVPNAWAGPGWKFHQYSSGGSVPGVQSNPTDLDVFDGDLTQLQTFAGQNAICGATPALPAPPSACGKLAPGQGLGPGASVTSCDGRFQLAMQGDGNLVLYSAGVPLWASGTNGQGYAAYMQGDGNLVIYSKGACAVWDSHSSGHPGAWLALQDDGNAVVYGSSGPLWNSQTGGLPASPTECGALKPGQALVPGRSIGSCDGRFALAMQGDGNLVLYSSGVPLWDSHTNGSPYRYAVMQGDGNFVIYAKGGAPVWASGTSNHPGTWLAIQGDGNAVLYDSAGPIWQSGTGGIPGSPSGCGVVQAGRALAPGDIVSSCDGSHFLAMQSDGNLVLYHAGVGAIWAAHTNGSPYRYAVMQGDGNFVVYAHGAGAVWNSGTANHPGAWLAVQGDGNLVLYLGSTPIWASGTNGR